MNDIAKLACLPNLKTITIHSNPFVSIPNFRFYVIGIKFLLAQLPHVKKVDSVLVSKKEKDNTKFWMSQPKFSKIPAVSNPAKPPK